MSKLSPEEMAEYRRPFAEPGEGRRHFVQEDSPDEIGQAIAAWRRKLG